MHDFPVKAALSLAYKIPNEYIYIIFSMLPCLLKE